MYEPSDLLFSKSHEWVFFEEDGTAVIGLSDYAQEALGDLVFVNLPVPGDDITTEEPFGDVESVKAVSDVYAPVSGTVSEVNEDLLDSPENINDSPYEAWLIKVTDVTDKGELMDDADYNAYVEEEKAKE